MPEYQPVTKHWTPAFAGVTTFYMAVINEDLMDRKYIISTSDDTLTPEDIALGHKQILEAERAFRGLLFPGSFFLDGERVFP